MPKILLVGNSAGASAIGETLKSFGGEVFTYGRIVNIGLENISSEYQVGPLNDFLQIQEFAKKIKPEFAFIVPGEPIADGLADMLETLNIPSIAPLKKVAALESSKAFSRHLVEKYDIGGNPLYKVFNNEEGLLDFIVSLKDNFVIKDDGFAEGKGVKIAGDHLSNSQEAYIYALECLKKEGKVVVEEKLIGQEFSLMAFCDGVHLASMPLVQDHKRALEDDKGSNTSGMGSYSDASHLLPFIKQRDFEQALEIMKKTVEAIFLETGLYYKGVLYGGFMATARGLKLLEFNVRTGDPEVINTFSLLQTNLVDVCRSIIQGDLSQLKVTFAHKATVCKYVVPNGYPEVLHNNETITVEDLPENVRMYYANVQRNGRNLTLSSLRALAFLGTGDSLEEAERLAERGCLTVKGNVYHRKDIGTFELIQKRVTMMDNLRAINKN